MNLFSVYQKCLKNAGLSEPCLIVDQQKLQANIRKLKQNVGEKAVRLVVKSLPSIPLLQFASERLGTNRFMCFQKPFVLSILEHFDDADIMLGKPLPTNAVESIVQTLIDNGDAKRLDCIHWLVDDLQRCQQLLMVARKHNIRLRVAIELDIGMHRGGVDKPEQLTELVNCINANRKQLQLSGLSGYDAHVGKAFWPFIDAQQEFAKANNRYQQFIDALADDADKLIFNGGGSLTHTLHKNSCCNEISVGSVLLKPADFNTQLLQDYENACFIATPVIKRLPGVTVPFLPDKFNKLLYQDFDSIFLYGGRWLAQPMYPDLRASRLYGLSASQQLMLVAKSDKLAVDDMVFFLPTRTESILLQFGCMVVLAEDKQMRVSGCWPVLHQGGKVDTERRTQRQRSRQKNEVDEELRARDVVIEQTRR
ncbi:alanine racemase [Thalassotalea maritima]|uniref:alanine racemase n=1 Tax=Thalassotalea maritima TaxID=3242416 RepID=UPI0035272A1A